MILEATLISLKVVTLSLLVTFIISMIAVVLMGKSKSKYIKYIEVLLILPMFMPPSAIGYLILLVLGRNSFIGRILKSTFNISIIFTITAAVIAAIVVTIPIMYKNIKVAIESVDEKLKEAAKDCGANEIQVFVRITLPLAKKGILNGFVLSFARAFGEFGATILVAGNLPGKTQTLPMAMYYAIEGSKNNEATKIFIIVLIIAVFLMSIHNYLSKEW